MENKPRRSNLTIQIIGAMRLLIFFGFVVSLAMVVVWFNAPESRNSQLEILKNLIFFGVSSIIYLICVVWTSDIQTNNKN